MKHLRSALLSLAVLPANSLRNCLRPAGDGFGSTLPASPAADFLNNRATGRNRRWSSWAGFPIKGRAPKTGYSREEFGPAWADVDHNGCDTRNDILARDLTE